MPISSGADHEGPIATSGSDPADATMLLAHAAGFCKELWHPVVAALRREQPDVEALLIDTRGHGQSTPHPGPFDPASIASDIIEIVDRIDRPVVGVGHSSGGAALPRVEAHRPGTFSKLVLIEPIIIEPPYARRETPLSISAAKRRVHFASAERARRRFEKPFASWKPEVLDLYVEHAFEHTDDGLVLRCLPEVEAEVYREGLNNDVWELIPHIRVPVTVVAGETSDTLTSSHLDRIVERFDDATLVVAEGHGHLVPMEAPDLIAEIIARA
ncbi:MAG: alpha/beta hydrolase [Acidimicrobiia bacterium]